MSDGVNKRIHMIGLKIADLDLCCRQQAQVKELGDDARHANVSGACCTRLKKHFQNSVGMALDDADCHHFLEGVTSMMKTISEQPHSIYADLKDTVLAQYSHVEHDLRLVEHFSAIDPEFLAGNASALLHKDLPDTG